MDRNELTYAIRGAAFKVHSKLGPGLLESVYERCLTYELRKRFHVETQLAVPFTYDTLQIDVGYRMDIVVENTVVIELKATEKILPIHSAQLLTYMRLSKISLGLLMNFNVSNMQTGIKRYIMEKGMK
ncbi:GxxExxY protein [Neolewinella litorea]|nr:GxxExxY protein [Neolewinella litorea]